MFFFGENRRDNLGSGVRNRSQDRTHNGISFRREEGEQNDVLVRIAVALMFVEICPVFNRRIIRQVPYQARCE